MKFRPISYTPRSSSSSPMKEKSSFIPNSLSDKNPYFDKTSDQSSRFDESRKFDESRRLDDSRRLDQSIEKLNSYASSFELIHDLALQSYKSSTVQQEHINKIDLELKGIKESISRQQSSSDSNKLNIILLLVAIILFCFLLVLILWKTSSPPPVLACCQPSPSFAFSRKSVG